MLKAVIVFLPENKLIFLLSGYVVHICCSYGLTVTVIAPGGVFLSAS